MGSKQSENWVRKVIRKYTGRDRVSLASRGFGRGR